DSSASNDDIPGDALVTFFGSLDIDESWFLFVEIVGTGAETPGALCTERADFYVDSYLDAVGTGGIVTSGSWNKHVRPAGGAWSSAITASHENWYGVDCGDADLDWCIEVGISNGSETFNNAFVPNQTLDATSELYSDVGSQGRDWVFTLRIGPDRQRACGF